MYAPDSPLGGVGNPNLMLTMPGSLYATEHNGSVTFQEVRSSADFFWNNRTMGGGQWDEAMKASPNTPEGWDFDQLGTRYNQGNRSLKEVLRFYNTRDTNPELWYPVVDGKVQKFDDLPGKYRANIDPQVPLDGRAPGSKPPMSDQDLMDLEAFLNTLTDGYRPPLPQTTSTRDADALGAALENYLARQGNLCLGKFRWPVIVRENDRPGGNAVQMPVLKRLGLVSAERLTGTGDATRYELTDKGRGYYIQRDLTRKLSSGKEDVHHADLCAAKLRLDRVVSREPAGGVVDNQRVTLTYTYRIDPATWARDADVRKVFPMLARMLDGERKLQLTQAFVSHEGQWVAVSPFD